MDDIKEAIKLLSKHGFKSHSRVVGEYIERVIALALKGELSDYCQEGFDVFSRELGKVEIKSRNYYAKSYQCNLPDKKMKVLDNFVLVIVKDAEIEKALLFSKKILNSIKSSSGMVRVDKKHFEYSTDITNRVKEITKNPIFT